MRLGLLASFIALVFMVIFSAYGLYAIPNGAVIATHWGLDGEANGFSPRNHVLALTPILGLALTALFAAIPVIDPRKSNIKHSSALWRTSWIGTMALLCFAHALIILNAAGAADAAAMFSIMTYGLAVFIAVMGNYIAKSRSNFFLGVRTPWTLSSEHAWIVANRAAGWMFLLTGLLTAGATFFSGPETGLKALLAGVLASALISAVISYFAWRADPERDEE